MLVRAGSAIAPAAVAASRATAHLGGHAHPLQRLDDLRPDSACRHALRLQVHNHRSMRSICRKIDAHTYCD